MVSDSVAVSETAVAPEPAVAVIVTVLFPAGVPGLAGDRVEALPPAPQLLAMALPAASSNSMSPRRSTQGGSFLPQARRRQKASMDPLPSSGQGFPLRALVAAVVEMVMIVVAAAVPSGVTVAGEKLHEAWLGNPEQANDTCRLKPFCGAMLSVAVPLLPGATESAKGAAARLKPGLPPGAALA